MKAFIEERLMFIDAIPVKRKANILHFENDASEADIFTTIQAEASRLHDVHAVPINDKKFSIGLIRIANIKNVINVFKHFSKVLEML